MRMRRRVTVRMASNPPAAAKVRQEPERLCNINNIVAQAKRGVPPAWVNTTQPVYADVSEIPRDLTEAFSVVQRAEAAFMSLPAEFRTAIDNDPRRIREFLANPANREAAVRYGLIEKPEEAPPAPSSPKAKAASEPKGEPKDEA